MKNYINPKSSEWSSILKRPTMELEQMEALVSPVMQEVQLRGDEALLGFTTKFDGVSLDDIRVSSEEIERAGDYVSDELKAAILQAASNIRQFHEAQIKEPITVETMPGVKCSRKAVAIDKVGLYIPGGTAPLFSTVLMLAIPAKIAGCEEIVICTPPSPEAKIHPAILYAASVVGVDKLYKVGGAQAIAAMTFGTETIPQVHKIFGPGNQYVTAAKQLAIKHGLAIDMPAGPSEVAVYADHSAIPAFVAADLLSQAEHGVDSQVLLVADTQEVVKAVQEELNLQLKDLPRQEIARKALEHSISIVLTDQQNAIDLLNDYGAEHLILSVQDPHKISAKIKNAGSVFLGNLTPESAGDYASGTNHTLPTNGYAKMYSGVSLDSYVKMITYQELTEEGIRNLGPIVEKMAAAEQLEAHKNAVTLRLKSVSDV